MGELVSAPYCAKLLADYGADVIKIEPPGSGDLARRWGPFPGDEPHLEKSGLFFFLNTNKRGVTIELSRPEGRSLLDRLIEQADILVENVAADRVEPLGLDYGRLAEINPDLVVISVTPFGRSGPYAEWAACDLNAYHLTGASHRYCGRPGQPPLEHGTFSADFYGAMTAAAWGLAAAYGCERVGGGQHVDVSSAEAIAATFVGGQNIGGFAQDGKYDVRTGVGMSLGAPATILPCKDGFVWILALELGQWKGLVRAMGDPEWAGLDMWDDMFTRAQNSDAMYPLIEQWTMEHTKFEIMERCQANGVPVTAVFTVAEAAEHPHLAERAYIVELEHPFLGKVRDLGPPFKLPACPGGPVRPAPLLGQHNEEIFGEELGVPSSELERLKREGTI